MKELGGYFELELSQGEHYHKYAIALNSARNCFKYILKAQRPTKVYVPAYCCDSLIEPLVSESIEYEFYHVDSKFEIEKIPSLQVGEKLVYINYFALKAHYVMELYKHLSKSLIVDNTQAFFEKPIEGVDTFYSPRKFFGVADGGYLYSESVLQEEFEQDCSLARSRHLIGRYEQTASSFYSAYQVSEQSLVSQAIKRMSPLTSGILKSLDYERIALIRQRNFWALHSQLINENRFKRFKCIDFVPMVYPFFTEKIKLRTKLIENKIYVAKYWTEAEVRASFFEKEVINDMQCLPVDQRMTNHSVSKLIKVIKDEH